jgi:hypothetical protein
MALIPGLIGVIAMRTLLLRRYGGPGNGSANEQAADAAKRHKR